MTQRAHPLFRSFLFVKVLRTKWHFISRFWLNEVRNLSAKGPLKCTTTWTWLYVPFQSLIKGVTHSSLITVMIARDYNWKLDILVTWKSFSGYSISCRFDRTHASKKCISIRFPYGFCVVKCISALCPSLILFSYSIVQFATHAESTRLPAVTDMRQFSTLWSSFHYGRKCLFCDFQKSFNFRRRALYRQMHEPQREIKGRAPQMNHEIYKGLLQLIYQHIKSDAFFRSATSGSYLELHAQYGFSKVHFSISALIISF